MNKTKTKTTYGVYNLVEWQALLRMGKATVKIPFTGGSITTQGVTPATFTTENPVIQLAIERSPEFSNGKIKVVRRVELDGVVVIECNAPKPTPNAPATEQACNPESPVEENDNAPANPDAEPNAEPEAQSDEVVPTPTAVEFSCNDDAKDYLEQTFGFVRSKLHNREDIIAAGKSKGVDIIFV